MEPKTSDLFHRRVQVPVKFKRLPHGEGLPIPTYTNSDAVGMDIAAAESVALVPGRTFLMPTGWSVELPPGFELQVRSRSGLAAKHGVFVTNGPGTIDPDYRGEVKVALSCVGRQTLHIERGDRVGQLVLAPVWRASVTEVDTLGSTERGTGGFGSTGR